jgi:hypothetical protein
MPDMMSFCKWLEHTSVGTHVRESLWLFPTVETLHLFGIVLLVGSTSFFDLRLLNLTMKDQPVSRIVDKLQGFVWAGFIVQVVTGFLMFASEATKMYINDAFRLKMLMIVAAGLNAGLFHFTAYRHVDKWGTSGSTPFAAKVAGVLSILLWFGIVAAGRWIAFI